MQLETDHDDPEDRKAQERLLDFMDHLVAALEAK